jgi:hypothetical protein
LWLEFGNKNFPKFRLCKDRLFIQEYKFFDGLVLSEKGTKKVWSNIISDTYPSVLALEKSFGKQTESEKSGLYAERTLPSNSHVKAMQFGECRNRF